MFDMDQTGIDREGLKALFKAELIGALKCCKAALSFMRAVQGGGSDAAVSSEGGASGEDDNDLSIYGGKSSTIKVHMPCPCHPWSALAAHTMWWALQENSIGSLYDSMGGDVIVAELTGQALYSAGKEEGSDKITHAEFRAFLKANKVSCRLDMPVSTTCMRKKAPAPPRCLMAPEPCHSLWPLWWSEALFSNWFTSIETWAGSNQTVLED